MEVDDYSILCYHRPITNIQCVGQKSSYRLRGTPKSSTHINSTLNRISLWPTLRVRAVHPPCCSAIEDKLAQMYTYKYGGVGFICAN